MWLSNGDIMKKQLFLLVLLAAFMCACKEKNQPAEITIDPTVKAIETTGGEFVVTLKSTAAWNATTNQAWISISPNSGQGDAYVTIKVAAGELDRADVLFSNGGSTATLAVIRGLDPSIPKGAVQGRFSVSDTKQVYFSQGNLQYQASTETWRFAEHQWDMVGIGYGQTDAENYCKIGGTVENSDNRMISNNYAGWIDLFGWGTGSNPTNVSTDPTDYETFTDWGVNQIGNGGNIANQWRTLTSDEWNYLFDVRTNASNLRGLATVKGIRGYVFLADVFVVPAGLSFTANPNSWAKNVYTSAQWAQMEVIGAVFLPCAGIRFTLDNTVCNVGDKGYCWSSTPGGAFASNLYFYSGGASVSNAHRDSGLSVRLVQDIE